MNDRVLVAMSGGVDSSLAAALLKEQGFVVEGVTMKLTAGICCDIASAQAVCGRLGILHHVIDMQAEFDRTVVRDFIDEYRRGRTPNPCIRCNEIIKFERLLGYARSAGFDRLATGHYARIATDPASARPALRTGVDPEKDQSYFLYRLTADQLARTLFPLGDLRKTEVRRLAAERRLPAAERPDSQEVCFIPDNDYRAFLREHAPDVLREGELVLTDGTVVGRHEGISFFTVGQRRRLGVAAGERLYVIRIEPATGRVVLGTRAELDVPAMHLSRLRLLRAGLLAGPSRAMVKVRYRSAFAPALLTPAGPDRMQVAFDIPVPGVTPGQAAVFYDGDIVIGGGIIEG